MMSKLSKFLVFVFVVFLPHKALCLEESLRSLIKTALEYNLNLKSQRVFLSKQEAEFSKAKKEKYNFRVNLSTSVGMLKTTSLEEDVQGVEYKQKITEQEGPQMELGTSVSYPHPWGGNLKVNLSNTLSVRNVKQDSWTFLLKSEEPLSLYQRRIIKNPLLDEQDQIVASELNVKDKSNSVIYEAVTYFYRLQKLNLELILKTKEIEEVKDNVQMAKLKFEKGIIPEIDLMQMEFQFSMLQTSLSSIEKNKKEELIRFSNFLGVPDDAIKFEPKEIKDEDLFIKIKRLKGKIENKVEVFSKIKESFEIKIKHIVIEAAKRKLKNAQTKKCVVLIPSFEVNKVVAKEEMAIRLSLEFPLFDNGVNKEEIRIAEYTLSENKIDFDNTYANLQAELKISLDEIKDKEEKELIQGKNITLLEKIYEIAKIKYQRGIISSKDLLDYQRELFLQQKTFFDQQIDLYLDYIKIFKITGELYEIYLENSI